MRRTASEIIRDLEIRVASLENKFEKKSSEKSDLILDRIEQMIIDKKPGTRSWDMIIEEMEDYLDKYYDNNIGIRNQFQHFKMLSRIPKNALRSLSEFRDALKIAQRKSKKFASLERLADTSLTHDVIRRVLQELNKYTGLKFNNSFSDVSVIKRDTFKRSNSDIVWVKVQDDEKFAYVIFELLPLGLAMNFMFYDLEDYKMAKKDFSKFVQRGKI